MKKSTWNQKRYGCKALTSRPPEQVHEVWTSNTWAINFNIALEIEQCKQSRVN